VYVPAIFYLIIFFIISSRTNTSGDKRFPVEGSDIARIQKGIDHLQSIVTNLQILLDTVVNGKPKRRSGVSGSQGLSGAVTPIEGGASSKVRSPDSDQLSPSGRRLTPAEIKRKELKRMIDEMNADGDGTAPVVKLGDASMAAPFTAKHSSVRPVTDIIRQGRSTLVTTLQMFKILGLNCLATAYVLSVMYLDGVKLGDMQVGLFHFGCVFHFYSWLLCVKVFQYWPAVFSYMHAFITELVFRNL
jgi:hypothetical protein